MLRDNLNQLSSSERESLILDIANLGRQAGLILPATQILADSWGIEGAELHLDVLQTQYNLSIADTEKLRDLWQRSLNGETLTDDENSFLIEAIGQEIEYRNAF